LDEENAVDTIIELMGSEHQSLIRLQKPITFMELNGETYTVGNQFQRRGKTYWENPKPEKPKGLL